MEPIDWRELVLRNLHGELAAEERVALERRLVEDPDLAADARDLAAAERALNSLKESVAPRTPPPAPGQAPAAAATGDADRRERLFARSRHELPVIAAHVKETRALFAALESGAPRRERRPARRARMASLALLTTLVVVSVVLLNRPATRVAPPPRPVVAFLREGAPGGVQVSADDRDWTPPPADGRLLSGSFVRTLAGGRCRVALAGHALVLAGDAKVRVTNLEEAEIIYGDVEAEAGAAPARLLLTAAEGRLTLSDARAEVRRPGSFRVPADGPQRGSDGRFTYRAWRVSVRDVLADSRAVLGADPQPDPGATVQDRLQHPVSLCCAGVTADEFREVLAGALGAAGLLLEDGRLREHPVRKPAGQVGEGLLEVRVTAGAVKFSNPDGTGEISVEAGFIAAAGTGALLPGRMSPAVQARADWWWPHGDPVVKVPDLKVVAVYGGADGGRFVRARRKEAGKWVESTREFSVGDRIPLEGGREGRIRRVLRDGIELEQDGRTAVVPVAAD